MNNEYRVHLKRYLVKLFPGYNIRVKKDGNGTKIGWETKSAKPPSQSEQAKITDSFEEAAKLFWLQWISQNTNTRVK